MILASQYIAKLQELVRIHGDLPCVDTFSNDIGTPEWNDDDNDNPVFVLADTA